MYFKIVLFYKLHPRALANLVIFWRSFPLLATVCRRSEPREVRFARPWLCHDYMALASPDDHVRNCSRIYYCQITVSEEEPIMT